MNRYVIFLLCFIIFGNKIAAQSTHLIYILKGTINLDFGKIKLVSIGDDIYYPGNSGYQEAEIKDGNYIFTDSIQYPYACIYDENIGDIN